MSFEVPHLLSLLFSLFVNNVHHVLCHSRIHGFSDDMKLYIHIGSIDDCLNLQFDLNRFVKWFKGIGLNLNLSKCKVIIFTRYNLSTIHSYNLFGSDILRADNSIINLGLKLNNSLNSNIEKLYYKTLLIYLLKILNFIRQLKFYIVYSFNLYCLFDFCFKSIHC